MPNRRSKGMFSGDTIKLVPDEGQETFTLPLPMDQVPTLGTGKLPGPHPQHVGLTRAEARERAKALQAAFVQQNLGKPRIVWASPQAEGAQS